MADIDNVAREKRIDKLRRMSFELDDICHEIWFTLMAKKILRFNELHRSLKKFRMNISHPTLKAHLYHLIELNVIERKEVDSQNVTYGLTEEIYSILHGSKIDINEWYKVIEERYEKFSNLKMIKIDLKKHYAKLSEKELDREIDRDLSIILIENLHSLKNFVNYDLSLEKNESYEAFWKFIGNPFFRMLQKMISETCRESERYKNRLFEKINTSTGVIDKNKKPPKFYIFGNSKNNSEQ